MESRRDATFKKSCHRLLNLSSEQIRMESRRDATFKKSCHRLLNLSSEQIGQGMVGIASKEETIVLIRNIENQREALIRAVDEILLVAKYG